MNQGAVSVFMAYDALAFVAGDSMAHAAACPLGHEGGSGGAPA